MEAKSNYFKRIQKNIEKHHELYLLIIPSLVYYIVFLYIPMYGVQIAFRDYMPGKRLPGKRLGWPCQF